MTVVDATKVEVSRLPSVTGVYQFLCLPTGDTYIGASANIENRRVQHFAQLSMGSHPVEAMQSLFDEHGRESFLCSVLRVCDDESDVFEIEKHLIRVLNPTLNQNVYTPSSKPTKRRERFGTLTARQQQVLTLIAEYQAAHDGSSPTMQELGDALGVTKVTVFEYIGELERKGWVTRRTNQSRSIQIVSIACPKCGRPVDEDPKNVAAESPERLAFVGDVA